MTKVILGGGLSGLSAAYYLNKFTGGEKLMLLESSSRLGGWVKSERVDKEAIFEQGPRTIRPGGAAGINTLNLLDELNLHSDIIPISRTNVVARNRLIYANGGLHCLPNSLLSLLLPQEPFSKPILFQILRDLTAKPNIVPDESVYEFTKRRVGTEIADYLIDTLICGICAGNSREVSVNFLMKKMFLYEQKYGSVIKGVLKHMFDKKKKLPTQGLLAARSRMQRWNVYTFKNGMETLPNTLEAVLRGLSNTDIQLKAECKELTFQGKDKASVFLKDGTRYDASHIISSIPARKLAPLVEKQHPELASKLAKTKSVTVGVINFLYKGNLIKNPAFGFLVPPKEKLPILGVIYDSCSRNYKDKTLLTVMMGGYWFQDLFGENPSEEVLLKVAADNLQSILDISERPVQYKVNILRDCIPQYIVGHQQNLEEMNSYIRNKSLPLSLCGASYHGLGVNDVILSANTVVRDLVSKSVS